MPPSPSSTTTGRASRVAARDDAARDAAGGALALAALVLLAALLRFPTLATQSVWFDEAATWELMLLPLDELLRALPERESNPPLFYLLEWAWTRALGDGEWALRSPSALAGTLLVPVAYGIGRGVGGRAAGLATAALVAVNPLLVWFSQEARSYELVALLSACALLAFLRALDDDRRSALALWALAGALALCSHYFAAFVLAPQAAWLLWRHRRRGAAAVAVGALAAVGLALLPLLLAQRDNPYDIAEASLAVRLAQLPKQFLLGYHGPLELAAGLLGAALVAAALWSLARHAPPAVRARAALVAATGVGGIALALGAAAVGYDYVNTRNLLPALVPLLAAVGAGAAALGDATPPAARARAGALVVATLCALSVALVVAVATDPAHQRPDWRGLADALGTTADDRVLVISPANGWLALRYYRRDLRMLGHEGAPVRRVEVVGVAGRPGVGEPARLPAQHGTGYDAYPFAEPDRVATDTYVMLRFTQPSPVLVQPTPVAVVRFSADPPTVALLPGARR